MRNLYIRRKENGKRPVVQLDAHSDEVGFMVQQSARTEHFALFSSEVGLTTIFAHKVWVRNRFRRIYSGITASKPPHFATEQERKAPLDMKDITVDVGRFERKRQWKSSGFGSGNR